MQDSSADAPSTYAPSFDDSDDPVAGCSVSLRYKPCCHRVAGFTRGIAGAAQQLPSCCWKDGSPTCCVEQVILTLSIHRWTSLDCRRGALLRAAVKISAEHAPLETESLLSNLQREISNIAGRSQATLGSGSQQLDMLSARRTPHTTRRCCAGRHMGVFKGR